MKHDRSSNEAPPTSIAIAAGVGGGITTMSQGGESQYKQRAVSEMCSASAMQNNEEKSSGKAGQKLSDVNALKASPHSNKDMVLRSSARQKMIIEQQQQRKQSSCSGGLLPLAKSRVLDRLKFKEKELVWAKVKGHPWWPAIVGQINYNIPRDREMKYIVYFVGDKTKSLLTEKFIRNFRSTFFQLAFIRKTNNIRQLRVSIRQACKLQEQLDPTFREHVQQTIRELANQSHSDDNQGSPGGISDLMRKNSPAAKDKDQYRYHAATLGTNTKDKGHYNQNTSSSAMLPIEAIRKLSDQYFNFASGAQSSSGGGKTVANNQQSMVQQQSSSQPAALGGRKASANNASAQGGSLTKQYNKGKSAGIKDFIVKNQSDKSSLDQSYVVPSQQDDDSDSSSLSSSTSRARSYQKKSKDHPPPRSKKPIYARSLNPSNRMQQNAAADAANPTLPVKAPAVAPTTLKQAAAQRQDTSNPEVASNTLNQQKQAAQSSGIPSMVKKILLPQNSPQTAALPSQIQSQQQQQDSQQILGKRKRMPGQQDTATTVAVQQNYQANKKNNMGSNSGKQQLPGSTNQQVAATGASVTANSANAADTGDAAHQKKDRLSSENAGVNVINQKQQQSQSISKPTTALQKTSFEKKPQNQQILRQNQQEKTATQHKQTTSGSPNPKIANKQPPPNLQTENTAANNNSGRKSNNPNQNAATQRQPPNTNQSNQKQFGQSYPFHVEKTTCGECQSIIQISFRCAYINEESNNQQIQQDTQLSQISELNSADALMFQQHDQQMMVKPTFIKMQEIGEQYEIDFASFNHMQNRRKDTDKNSVKTKMVHMTQSEWNFMQKERWHQVSVKKLLRIRNCIQDECEQLIQKLDDLNSFFLHFQRIEEYLQSLHESEHWITVQNLDDSRICECLSYLIDLCLVISKHDINLYRVKQIGQQALELITHWRSLVIQQVTNEGQDYKSEIQNILREYYPTQFGIKRSFHQTFGSPSVIYAAPALQQKANTAHQNQTHSMNQFGTAAATGPGGQLLNSSVLQHNSVPDQLQQSQFMHHPLKTQVQLHHQQVAEGAVLSQPAHHAASNANSRYPHHIPQQTSQNIEMQQQPQPQPYQEQQQHANSNQMMIVNQQQLQQQFQQQAANQQSQQMPLPQQTAHGYNNHTNATNAAIINSTSSQIAAQSQQQPTQSKQQSQQHHQKQFNNPSAATQQQAYQQQQSRGGPQLPTQNPPPFVPPPTAATLPLPPSMSQTSQSQPHSQQSFQQQYVPQHHQTQYSHLSQSIEGGGQLPTQQQQMLASMQQQQMQPLVALSASQTASSQQQQMKQFHQQSAQQQPPQTQKQQQQSIVDYEASGSLASGNLPQQQQ